MEVQEVAELEVGQAERGIKIRRSRSATLKMFEERLEASPTKLQDGVIPMPEFLAEAQHFLTPTFNVLTAVAEEDDIEPQAAATSQPQPAARDKPADVRQVWRPW